MEEEAEALHSKMNKKATFAETLWKNFVYLALFALFFSGMLYFVLQQKNGAEAWSQYYSKEISKVINLAEPGAQITLDVHRATEIADKSGLATYKEIFTFDNRKKEICVKLSPRRATCYYYFNDVDIIRPEIKLASPKNVLTFQIAETRDV